MNEIEIEIVSVIEEAKANSLKHWINDINFLKQLVKDNRLVSELGTTLNTEKINQMILNLTFLQVSQVAKYCIGDDKVIKLEFNEKQDGNYVIKQHPFLGTILALIHLDCFYKKGIPIAPRPLFTLTLNSYKLL